MDANDPTPAAGDLPAEAPAGSGLPIFINYRHEDMPFAASALYRELKVRFGAENIFFDGGTLRPGMQFLEQIKSHLNGPTGAFLALIGSKWLSTMDDHRRRGDEDYVLEEIELGLRKGWTVIPVLLNGAPLPQPPRLPMAIRALPGYQAAYLRQTSMDEDVDELSGRLDEIGAHLDEAAEVRPPPDVVTEPPDETPDARDVPPEGATAEGGLPEVLPANDEHYQMLVDEADNLVIFVGAGANADDREGPFRTGASMLPDDTDLADYLAGKARFTDYLALKAARKKPGPELAEVAQYARMIRGEPRMFSWVRSIFVNCEPGPVHRYLAHLPQRLEELGLEKRYQMIVTPKFDVALEQAFIEAKEPFDVAVYMAPGTEHAGRFVHLKWGSVDPQPIQKPNEYDDFPIDAGSSELTRTVIVRISGAVDYEDIGYRWKNNYVITEDHYIDYFGGRRAEEVVPSQILEKLRQASCLFLGYAISDWRLRVFLHWIWPGERPSGATHWAVERSPDMLERRFWQRNDVDLYQSRLTDYVNGFDRFLVKHRDELMTS
jgi:SIR2-like domain/TIR domain